MNGVFPGHVSARLVNHWSRLIVANLPEVFTCDLCNEWCTDAGTSQCACIAIVTGLTLTVCSAQIECYLIYNFLLFYIFYNFVFNVCWQITWNEIEEVWVQSHLDLTYRLYVDISLHQLYIFAVLHFKSTHTSSQCLSSILLSLNSQRNKQPTLVYKLATCHGWDKSNTAWTSK